MRTDEIQAMSDDELEAALDNTAADLFRLRFQHRTGQLSNTAQLKAMRQTLARMKTLRQERKLAADRGGAR